MLHSRAVIRHAVRDALAAQAEDETWPTAAQDRVYASRSAPLSVKRLPAILIYTRDERNDPTDEFAVPGRRKRILRLALECVAAGDEADEAVDDLAAAVERMFDLDNTIGRRADKTILVQTEMAEDADGETPVVVCRLTFEVTYWTISTELEDDETTSPGEGGDLLVGWAPEIGPPHVDDYVPVERLPVGDCGEA